MFFALVHPNSKEMLNWESATDLKSIETMKLECNQRMEECFHPAEKPSASVDYRDIYDRIISLNSSILKTDILDVIWVISDLQIMSPSQLSVQASARKAAYLYQAFNAIQQSNPALQFTLLSNHTSNDLLVWSSLLHSTVYWIDPISLSPPKPSISLESEVPSEVPANTNSFIVEDSPKISVSLAKSAELSQLPLIQSSEAFELDSHELEMVCARLVAFGINGRCQIEWCLNENGFLSDDVFTLIYPNEPVVSFHHYAFNMGVIQNQEKSMITLSPSYPIQIITQYHPVEISFILHMILGQSEIISLIPSHPQKNVLFSHIQKTGELSAFFGCSVVCELSNRSKLACLPAILSCDSHSFTLYVNIEEYMSSSWLSHLITKCANHPAYHMIVDSDITSLSHFDFNPLLLFF